MLMKLLFLALSDVKCMAKVSIGSEGFLGVALAAINYLGTLGTAGIARRWQEIASLDYISASFHAAVASETLQSSSVRSCQG